MLRIIVGNRTIKKGIILLKQQKNRERGRRKEDAADSKDRRICAQAHRFQKDDR